MTENTIDYICNKIGATTETLIPKVVELGKAECRITTEITVILLFLFIIGIVICVLIHREASFDAEAVTEILIVVFSVGILFSAGFLISARVNLAKWNAYPEMMAMKYILQAAGGC